MNVAYKEYDEAYAAMTEAQKTQYETYYKDNLTSKKLMEADSVTDGVRDNDFGQVATMKDSNSWQYFWGTCVQYRYKLISSDVYAITNVLSRGFYWWFFFSYFEDEAKTWLV